MQEEQEAIHLTSWRLEIITQVKIRNTADILILIGGKIERGHITHHQQAREEEAPKSHDEEAIDARQEQLHFKHTFNSKTNEPRETLP